MTDLVLFGVIPRAVSWPEGSAFRSGACLQALLGRGYPAP
jgi:hypothetical protein